MKFLALSVILALAVTLSSGFSVEHALHQEEPLQDHSWQDLRSRRRRTPHDDLSAEPRHDRRPQPPRVLRGNSIVHDSRQLQSPIQCRLAQPGTRHRFKDQGQCGGCWSFSATGALEGQYFRKTGQLISLSEQNLIDCSSSYGNHGCNGGVVQWAYNYIKDNRGVDTESSYPYEGRDASCRYSSAYRGATCTGYVSIRRNDENDLLNAVGSV